jgi:hypothetical protein
MGQALRANLAGRSLRTTLPGHSRLGTHRHALWPKIGDDQLGPAFAFARSMRRLDLKRFCLLLTWLAAACSGHALKEAPGNDPEQTSAGAGAAQGGRSGSLAPIELAGTGHGGASGRCAPVYNGGATITVPVHWAGGEPPAGTFRACRNAECYESISAGAPIEPNELLISVGFQQRVLGLSWAGHFLGVDGDRYRLGFTPAGDTLELPLFDTAVSYRYMYSDTATDCLTGSFADSALTEPVELTPSAPDAAGGEGGEGGTSGAAGS